MQIEMSEMSEINQLTKNFGTRLLKVVVAKLAANYGFSETEAYGLFQEKKKINRKETRGPRYPYPYSGEVLSSCKALKSNHGLWSQCMTEACEESKYCKRCKKESEKNESGKPNNGDITDRDEKKAAEYLKVLRKLKVTPDEAREEAARCKIPLDEAHFVETEKSKGRPKKTDSDSDAEKKTARGRPKKAAKEVELTNETLFETELNLEIQVAQEKNLFAEIFKDDETPEPAPAKKEKKAAKKAVTAESDSETEAPAPKKEKKAAKKVVTAESESETEAPAPKKEKKAPKKKAEVEVAVVVPEPEPEPVEEEATEESVKPFEFGGKKYWISSNGTNVLYDPATQEPVGVWNENEKTIDELEEEEFSDDENNSDDE